MIDTIMFGFCLINIKNSPPTLVSLAKKSIISIITKYESTYLNLIVTSDLGNYMQQRNIYFLSLFQAFQEYHTKYFFFAFVVECEWDRHFGLKGRNFDIKSSRA